MNTSPISRATLLALLVCSLAPSRLPAQIVTEFPLPAGAGFEIAAGPSRLYWIAQPQANGIARATSWGEVREVAIPTEGADPRGIAATADGGAWFTEYGTNKIGRVSSALEIVEFPIPTADSGPFGIAVDDEGNAWFTEASASAIGRITPEGTVTEFPLPTANANPRRIVLGADGNLWFTETDANQIGRITPAGDVTEFPVPTPSSHPFGIAADVSGNLWFTETSGNAIGRITAAGTITEFPVPTAGVSPSGIAVGKEGGIWFTESEGHRIGRMSPSGTFVEVEIPTPESRPRGIAAGGDRHVWFVEEDGGRLARISPIVESQDAINAPRAMSANSVGDVFWISWDFQIVWRTEPRPNGSVGNGFLIPTAGSGPEGIAAGTQRDAWFTEFVANKIGHFYFDGLEPKIDEYPLPTPGVGAFRIALGPDGNFWFTESFGNAIGRITPAGVVTEFPLPTAGANPAGIVAGPDGALWFTEYDASQIGRITTSGTITEYPTPTDFAGPSAIAAGPDGNLWFTEVSANAIGRITPGGDVTEFPIPTAGSLPAGIAAGSDGNLWFTEFTGNKLGRVTTAGRIDEVALPTPTANPTSIVGMANGQIWFAEPGATQHGAFWPAGLGLAATSGPAAGGDPLTVMGFAFEEGCAVEVGGVPAAAEVVVDDRRIDTTTPALSPGTLADVEVLRPDGSIAVSPRARQADFLDVPGDDPFHFAVATIFRTGITSGCGGGNFCRTSPISRAQMAVFLMRAQEGPHFTPRPCHGAFDDVPCPSPFADAIEYLADMQITGGCGGGHFCPANPVTRAQMAVFLLKTRSGSNYAPPPCTGVFADVACPGAFAADWIEALAAARITSGCGGANYCPGSPATRGQMAVFLTRTFMP